MVLPSILISRFLVHLRQIDESSQMTQDEEAGSAGGAMSTVRFRNSIIDRVIGPLGGSLDHNTPIIWNDDEDEVVEIETETDSIQSEDDDASIAKLELCSYSPCSLTWPASSQHLGRNGGIDQVSGRTSASGVILRAFPRQVPQAVRV
ncbi:hypothetical protein EIP86_009338 [Pleurotus ostreatoroseus]|nr:hypothetical protein EIP86_009338 [Pleurotus ostreatoroseus]